MLCIQFCDINYVIFFAECSIQKTISNWELVLQTFHRICKRHWVFLVLLLQFFSNYFEIWFFWFGNITWWISAFNWWVQWWYSIWFQQSLCFIWNNINRSLIFCQFLGPLPFPKIKQNNFWVVHIKFKN